MPPTQNDDQDWAFCRQALAAVSRTFVRPIEMLPDDLERATTCGYLLCRIADAIEDHPRLDLDQRDLLYRRFLDVLEGDAPPQTFEDAWPPLEDEGADVHLARHLHILWRTFRRLDPFVQRRLPVWVAEMARGMAIYNHRPLEDDGWYALYSLADLERYCYFVAGTVGHMLTELFLAYLPSLTPEREGTLWRHAEAFGTGLQLVNVLKDITQDRQRRWSFVPRSLCWAEGLSIDELTDPAHRATAHRVVAPMFRLARASLAQGLEYALAIPVEHRGVRLFCLLPLWMALRTLRVAEGNDALFTPGVPVKISRLAVHRLIADAMRRVHDNESLRRRFHDLLELPAEAPLQPAL